MKRELSKDSFLGSGIANPYPTYHEWLKRGRLFWSTDFFGGVPDKDHAHFVRWMDELAMFLGNASSTVEAARQAKDALDKLINYFRELLPERRKHAGQIIQKFVTYRRCLVILGDISGHMAQSRAFKDLVSKANRGTHVWFLTGLQELNERLNRMQQRGLQ